MSPPTRRSVRAGYLGIVRYAGAEALQARVRAAVKDGSGDEHLLLLEHPHVFTLGRNADEADVLAPRAWLEAQGVEVHECDRGGQVTYHGPGQLVGYPIVDLDPDRRDLRRYVRDLQEVLIRTLADYGLEGGRRDGKDFIGVWVGDAKIASIGVHVSRWVTTHGFALNVSTDLSWFGRIVPCGLSRVEMASIETLTGAAPPVPEVAERLAGHFADVFDRDPAPLRLTDFDAEAPERGSGRGAFFAPGGAERDGERWGA
jgi:lipoyl(octanoyl) transferase